MGAAYERACILAAQKRFDLAIKELLAELGQDPNDADAHALLSQCYTCLGDWLHGCEAAQRAIALAPDGAQGHYALAVALYYSPDSQDQVFTEYGERRRSIRLGAARRVVLEAIRLTPEADYYELLARIDLQDEQPRHALLATADGLQIDPTHVGCLNRRADAHRRLAEYDAAEEASVAALRLAPDDADTRATHARVLLDKGRRPEAAAAHFRDALRLDPQDVAAQEGYVSALEARFALYRLAVRLGRWKVVRGAGMTVAALALAATAFCLFTAWRLGGTRDEASRRVALTIIKYTAAGPVVLLYLVLLPQLFLFPLQFDREGRRSLSRWHRFLGNLSAGLVLWTIAAAAVVAAAGVHGPALRRVLWCAPVLIPLSVAGAMRPGRYRQWSIACAAAAVALGVVTVLGRVALGDVPWRALAVLYAVVISVVTPSAIAALALYEGSVPAWGLLPRRWQAGVYYCGGAALAIGTAVAVRIAWGKDAVPLATMFAEPLMPLATSFGCRRGWRRAALWATAAAIALAAVTVAWADAAFPNVREWTRWVRALTFVGGFLLPFVFLAFEWSSDENGNDAPRPPIRD